MKTRTKPNSAATICHEDEQRHLVSYALKSGASHTITIAISEDTQAAQDAVDAEIARRYHPGQPRQGLLVQVIERLNEMRSLARNTSPAPQLSAKPERVMFPSRIWDIVEARWQELGYSSLSAYVTGLVRYDLLISGPHRSLPSATSRAKRDTVARQTLVSCRRGQKRKLYLAHPDSRASRRMSDLAFLRTAKPPRIPMRLSTRSKSMRARFANSRTMGGLREPSGQPIPISAKAAANIEQSDDTIRRSLTPTQQSATRNHQSSDTTHRSPPTPCR